MVAAPPAPRRALPLPLPQLRGQAAQLRAAAQAAPRAAVRAAQQAGGRLQADGLRGRGAGGGGVAARWELLAQQLFGAVVAMGAAWYKANSRAVSQWRR